MITWQLCCPSENCPLCGGRGTPLPLHLFRIKKEDRCKAGPQIPNDGWESRGRGFTRPLHLFLDEGVNPFV